MAALFAVSGVCSEPGSYGGSIYLDLRFWTTWNINKMVSRSFGAKPPCQDILRKWLWAVKLNKFRTKNKNIKFLSESCPVHLRTDWAPPPKQKLLSNIGIIFQILSGSWCWGRHLAGTPPFCRGGWSGCRRRCPLLSPCFSIFRLLSSQPISFLFIRRSLKAPCPWLRCIMSSEMSEFHLGKRASI